MVEFAQATGWGIQVSGDGRVEMDRALGLLREGLGPFVEREVAYNVQAARLDEFRRKNRLGPIGEWDAAALLRFMENKWHRMFEQVLGLEARGLVPELRNWRNKLAHQAQVTPGDIERALDSAARLLRAVNAEPQADEVAELRDRYIQAGRTPSPRQDPCPPVLNPAPLTAAKRMRFANTRWPLMSYRGASPMPTCSPSVLATSSAGWGCAMQRPTCAARWRAASSSPSPTWNS